MKTETGRVGEAFVLAPIFDDDWKIRVVLPGLDRGSAIWLECEVDRKTGEEVEELLGEVLKMLPGVRRGARYDAP